MNNRCIFCGNPIKKNTDEHILLNSLGGKLVHNGLICEECNNLFGKGIDSDLSKELSWCASLLDVDRDRGKNKNIETNNSIDYFLLPGGKPQLKRSIIHEDTLSNSIKNITIEASNKKQAEYSLKFIKKKYGDKIKVDDANIKQKNEFLNKKIPIEARMHPSMFPSIIKSAIEFCVINTNVCLDNVICAFNRKNYSNCYYYFEDIVDIRSDSIYHIVALFTYNRTLYCYINYFNIYGFLVILAGDIDFDIEELYIQDLVKNDVASNTLEYMINKEMLNNFKFSNNLTKSQHEKLKERINKFLKIYNQNSERKIIDRIYNEAEAEAITEYGEKCSPKVIVEKFINKIAPYLEHWAR